MTTIDDPGDPRLDEYRALNEPATRRRVERDGDYFVVEGVLAIERLLDITGSPVFRRPTIDRWSIRSLLLLPRLAERLADRLAEVQAPVLVAEPAVLNTVVGFDLHRGALASVARAPARPAIELLVPGRASLAAEGRTFVAAEGLNDHENLGALYRNAAAFGVAGVLLDTTSADPFYRRSIRVSMGHVLGVPTGDLGPAPSGLAALRDGGATIVALTPSADARPLRDLDRRELGPGPVVLLVGAEGPGLTAASLAVTDHRVRIEMAPGINSLNVATATAIALHHLAGKPERSTP